MLEHIVAHLKLCKRYTQLFGHYSHFHPHCQKRWPPSSRRLYDMAAKLALMSLSLSTVLAVPLKPAEHETGAQAGLTQVEKRQNGHFGASCQGWCPYDEVGNNCKLFPDQCGACPRCQALAPSSPPLPCEDDASYLDIYTCAEWTGYNCRPGGWGIDTAERIDLLVRSCPVACAGVDPECPTPSA